MTQKVICVDANFVVFLVQADSETSPFIVLWDEWQEQNYQIITPIGLTHRTNLLFCIDRNTLFHPCSDAF